MQVNGIEGIVKKVLFESEDKEFTVARFEDENGENYSIVGLLYGIRQDSKVRLWGRKETHPKYGEQVKVEHWEKVMPSSKEQVIEYLDSPFVKYVGRKQAEEIADVLGENAVDLIINHGPEILEQFKGIGETKAQRIYDSISDNLEAQYIVNELLPLGLSPRMSIKAYKEWGREAVGIITGDPYRLIELTNIGFQRADEIAGNMDIKKTSIYRLKAGLKYVLSREETNGHCFLKKEELVEGTLELLDLGSDCREDVCRALTEMLNSGYELYQQGERVYFLNIFRAEQKVADKVSELLANKSEELNCNADSLIREYEEDAGVKLAPEQVKAVKEIIERGILILTGGPGTGKTATVSTVIEVMKRIDPYSEIMLASPTGRAGQKLTEVTGEQACTIHRLLNFRQGEGPEYDETNPLQCDLLIVDEISMVDINLAAVLFDAISAGNTRVLLVGDADQLPSVGPGNVLSDLIEAGVPTVRLTYIFRQAQESQIVTNAHRVNNGENIYIDRDKEDFFFIEVKDPERIAEMVRQSVERFVERGYQPYDIQVLSPMRKGPIGTMALNNKLQESLNPNSKGAVEIKAGNTFYRVGDKVMQTKNNYNKAVFNGDLGVVEMIENDEEEDSKLSVRIRDNLIYYSRDEIVEELMLAYCTTIHKSQGSEYPVVIVPVSTSHYIMLARNLLYTAITRAEEKVVLIGTKKALAIAIKNDKLASRNTGLKEKLKSTRVI